MTPRGEPAPNLLRLVAEYASAHRKMPPGAPDRRILDYIVLLFVGITGLSVAGYYIAGSYWGKPYPYNTFLLSPDFRFSDFRDLVLLNRNLDPYREPPGSIYPPLANAFFALWSNFSFPVGLMFFLVFPIAGIFWLVTKLARAFGKLGAAALFLALFLFSYPVLFCLDRGNSELYVVLLLGVFFWLYEGDSETKRWCAAAALAGAIAFKIAPAVFCLIYLKDRRWLEICRVALLVFLLSFAALFLFRGSPAANIWEYAGQLQRAQGLTESSLLFSAFGTSVYDALRIIGTMMRQPDVDGTVISYYPAFVIVMITITSAKLWFGRHVLWETAIVLAALACLVPSISNDYKLCLLLVPVLLISLDSGITRLNYRLLMVTLAAAACAPKNWFVLLPTQFRGDISTGSILTPVILLALVSTVLFLPAGRRFSSREGRELIAVARAFWSRFGGQNRTNRNIVFGVGLVCGVMVCFLISEPLYSQIGLKSSALAKVADLPRLMPLARGGGKGIVSRLDMVIEFTPRSVGQVQNIFSTEFGNRGARLEYSGGNNAGRNSTNGTLVMVFGLQENKYFVLRLSDQIQSNRKYTLKLTLYENRQVHAQLDDNPPISGQLPGTSLVEFSGLRIGSLFDGAQEFLGPVQIDSFRCTISEIHAGLTGLILSLSIGSFLAYRALARPEQLNA